MPPIAMLAENAGPNSVNSELFIHLHTASSGHLVELHQVFILVIKVPWLGPEASSSYNCM